MCMTDHPGGYCIKMCSITNHDADCPSGSICQFDGMSGECHKGCSSGSDCRAGYMCAPASTDPNNTASHAFCDVADTSGDGGMQVDAGGGSQKLPIGSPCSMDSDCGGAGFMCMTDHPGGYCIKMCSITNHDADCPSGSICQFDGMSGECHKECSSGSDCRSGYVCAPASTDPNNVASHAFCDVAPPADGGTD
jgi:hypothetical protein